MVGLVLWMLCTAGGPSCRRLGRLGFHLSQLRTRLVLVAITPEAGSCCRGDAEMTITP